MPYKHLKPYIRYDKKGNIIGGSFTYKAKKPSGNYVQVISPAQPVCCTQTQRLNKNNNEQ